VRVRLAMVVTDILILGVSLALSLFMRLWFFAVAFAFFIATVLLVVHLVLNYPWVFVGRLTAEFVVPLVMAWAGVHLAADVKEQNQRQLWQFVFGALFFVGFTGGVFVEIKLDHDHKQELDNQRLGMKGDMIEALAKYNEAHPQHEVTIEQFQKIVQPLFSARPSAPQSSQPELIVRSRLQQQASDIAQTFREYFDAWEREEIQIRENAQYRYDDLSRPLQVRQQFMKDRDKQIVELNSQKRLETEMLLGRAKELRQQILTKAPEINETDEEKRTAALLTGAKAAESFGNLHFYADHFSDIAERLK
jgi:hypothetical protein